MPLADIITIILTGMVAGIGGLAVIVLNSIKDEIRDIKTSITGLEKDMRVGVGGLERRVTFLEAQNENNQHRREDNGRSHP